MELVAAPRGYDDNSKITHLRRFEEQMRIKRSSVLSIACPPLYTTTREGWLWHSQRAKTSLAAWIESAATRGIREAQRKSQSLPTPLRENREPEGRFGETSRITRVRSSNLAEFTRRDRIRTTAA